MASAAMVRPSRPPPPHSGGRPPPPPPKPPKPQAKVNVESKSVQHKRVPPPAPALATKRAKLGVAVSLIAPVEMRDWRSAFDQKHQVGQGTYGSVFVAQDRQSREIVALKRINTAQEANGFPITALREVKILKALNHVNIVNLKEIVTSREEGEGIPKDVYMVFEYLEYDLTGLLDTSQIKFTHDHVKSWSFQLLQGTHYMHQNKIVHRDLKPANLLVNKRGQLKIADWGLARSWNQEMSRLTNKVITLWYRPPELLLGAQVYTPKIDMWSIGCIVAEMFRRKGLLRASTEAAQLDFIFRTCGHPGAEDWASMTRSCKSPPDVPSEPRFPDRLKEHLLTDLPFPKWMTDKAVDFISKLLSMNPDKRWSAQQALDHDYFFESPLVKEAEELSMNFAVHSIHEYECKLKFEEKQKVIATR